MPRRAEPVTAITTTPQENWPRLYAVHRGHLPRPGPYKLLRTRISYTTDGHPGWQYQSLNTYMIVTTGGNPRANSAKLPSQDCRAHSPVARSPLSLSLRVRP
jgi:hypothetical protein